MGLFGFFGLEYERMEGFERHCRALLAGRIGIEEAMVGW